MLKRARRLLRRIVILTLLLLVAQFAAGKFLRRELISGFSKGTGCRVGIEAASVKFIPPRGVASGIAITCPSDSNDGGFHVNHLSVSLDPQQLLRKVVFLYDLDLQGTWAKAHDERGAFFRTLEFVLADSDSAPEEETWYPRPFSGWSAKLNNIIIDTETSGPRGLDLETGKFFFQWTKLHFESDIFPWDKKKPAATIAYADEFRIFPKTIVSASAEPAVISLGRIDVDVGLGGGKGDFKKIQLRNISATASASGGVQFASPHVLDFQFTSDYSHEALQALFRGLYIDLANYPLSAHLNGNVSGTVSEPKIESDVALQTLAPLSIFKRPQCSPQKASAHVVVTDETVLLSEVSVDDVVSNSQLAIALDDEHTFTGEVHAELGKEKAALQRCLGESQELQSDDAEAKTSKVGEITPSTSRWLSGDWSDAIAESSSRIIFQGKLQPLEVQAELHADIQHPDLGQSSKLSGKFRLTDKDLSGNLQEQGDRPTFESSRVETKPKHPNNLSDPSPRSSQTPFQVSYRSGISVAGNYTFANNEIDLPEIHLENYNLRFLFARVAPFITEAKLDRYADFVSPEAAVNASGALHLGGAKPLSGALETTFSNLSLTGAGSDTLFAKTEFSQGGKNGGMRLKQVVLTTPGGEAKGEGSKSESGDLHFMLQAENLDLAQLEIWKSNVGALPGSVSFHVEANGPSTKPKLSGLFTVKTQPTPELSIPTESELTLSSNAEQILLDGYLFNRGLSGYMHWPYLGFAGGSAASAFESKLTADKLPLAFLFSNDSGNPSDTQHSKTAARTSSLTGTFEYKGKPGVPKSGDGQIHIDELYVHRGEHSLVNKGPLLANIQHGLVSFSSVHLESGGRELQLLGSLDLARGWDARLSGAWEIGSFVNDFGGLEQVSGMLTSDVRLKGPVLGPELMGVIALNGGSVSVPLGRSVVGMSDVNIDAQLSGSDIKISQIRGHMGNGDVIGSGIVTDVFSSAERNVNVNLAFEDADIEPVDKLHLNLNGQLGIRQDGSNPVALSGELKIASGIYENTVRLIEIIQRITQWLIGIRSQGGTSVSVAARSEPSASFQVHLRTEDPVLIETNVASLELSGDINLTGTDIAPKVAGRLQSSTGTFGLSSKQFELLNGVITFSDQDTRIDPRLDILGESAIKDTMGDIHQVRLAIAGTFLQPKLTFSSDTGLPPREIVALLGLGSGSAGVTLFEAKKDADHSILELLNPVSGAGIEERVTGITGFSEVQIAPSFSSDTGEFAPKFVAKRPIVDPLNVEVETELKSENVSSMRLTYPLSEETSLFSGWRNRPVTDPQSSNGSFGAGITFRRTFPGLTLLPPELSDVNHEKRNGEAP